MTRHGSLEVFRVWKGCKDDDQSSDFVPVNDLLDLVPSLTRKWLRRLFNDKTSDKGGYLNVRQGRPRHHQDREHAGPGVCEGWWLCYGVAAC